jgi:deazaflavin-dependent oxidoreductase (nitroreductase family)
MIRSLDRTASVPFVVKGAFVEGNDHTADPGTGRSWLPAAERLIEVCGAAGYRWQGSAPTLILRTRGRRSGEQRASALIFGRDGEHCVVVASAGGSGRHPAWHLNLTAAPEVEVHVLAQRFPAIARTAVGDERARLWSLMAGVWPQYDDYRLRTDRDIPVVVLERTNAPVTAERR